MLERWLFSGHSLSINQGLDMESGTAMAVIKVLTITILRPLYQTRQNHSRERGSGHKGFLSVRLVVLLLLFLTDPPRLSF